MGTFSLVENAKSTYKDAVSGIDLDIFGTTAFPAPTKAELDSALTDRTPTTTKEGVQQQLVDKAIEENIASYNARVTAMEA